MNIVEGDISIVEGDTVLISWTGANRTNFCPFIGANHYPELKFWSIRK